MDYKEAFLYQSFPELGFSKRFCQVTELLGFFTPADLLNHQQNGLTRLPGFDMHLVEEFVNFIEDRGVGRYLD